MPIDDMGKCVTRGEIVHKRVARSPGGWRLRCVLREQRTGRAVAQDSSCNLAVLPPLFLRKRVAQTSVFEVCGFSGHHIPRIVF